MPFSPVPSPPQRFSWRDLRKLLLQTLRTDSEQDAFVLDFFGDVYREYTAGMDRNQKVNILFERYQPDEILQALEQQYPSGVREFISGTTRSEPETAKPHVASGSKLPPDSSLDAPHIVCLHAINSKIDRDAYRDLRLYLTPKLRAGSISLWGINDLLGGDRIDRAIAHNLDNASVVIFLVSPDFMADAQIDECVPQVLKRRSEGRCVVVPILLRASDWKSSRFGSLQPLPFDGVPLLAHKNRESAWVEVIQGLSQAIQYRPQRSAPIVTPPVAEPPARSALTNESTDVEHSVHSELTKEASLDIGVIFTVNEPPKYTYVEPENYGQLRGYLANGSRVVVQGPSGSGKSSIVSKALEELKLTARWVRCSEEDQVRDLVALLAQPIRERLVLDEAHLLDPEVQQLLASRLYNLTLPGQITVIGLGEVRGSLLRHIPPGLREPLAKRLMQVSLSSTRSPESQVNME